jgi:hypothetical protein
MTEDRDHDREVQDWFNRSVDEPPPQPFTLAVLARVRRRERQLRLQRYAAYLVAFFSFCLLLPELIAPLNMLAALPLAVADVGGEQWPLLVLMVASVTYWLIKHARNTVFLRRE